MMTKGLLLVICLSFMVGLVCLSYSAPMKLAGAWSFDDGSGKKVIDSVGGNNGELMGSTQLVAEGKIGGAVQFPGKGDSYVLIPHKDYMDADAYTFTAWIKLDAASWQYIAWNNGPVFPDQGAARHIDIWIHDADYPVFMWSVEGAADFVQLPGKTIVADGTWHHLAKWYDGKSIRMYIDGKMDVQAETQKLAKNGTDDLWIGARPGDVAATGLIDEVGLFTKALSEAELQAVMAASLTQIASLEAKGKLSTTWGEVKSTAK